MYQFKSSNNGAEYEPLIAGLRLAISLRVEKLRVKTDSRFVVGQLNGNFATKEKAMVLYKDVTEGLLVKLAAYEVHHVPRSENKEADILSKLALGGLPDYIACMCKLEEVEKPSTEALVVWPVDSD